MEDQVTLAVLINLVERLRSEQALIKSMLAAQAVQLDLIRAHGEATHAKAIVARDLGPKVRNIRDARGAVAPDPAGGKPGA